MYVFHIIHTLFLQQIFTQRKPFRVLVPRVIVRFPVLQASTTVKTNKSIAVIQVIETTISRGVTCSFTAQFLVKNCKWPSLLSICGLYGERKAKGSYIFFGRESETVTSSHIIYKKTTINSSNYVYEFIYVQESCNKIL